MNIGPDLIFLRPNASPSAVFEELIHSAQHRTGRYKEWANKFGNQAADFIAEHEAAKRLIKNREAYGISETEHLVNVTRRDGYAKRLKSLGIEYDQDW